MEQVDRKRYPLLVMSASAGSGKTHQLVLEYLSILLEEPDNGSNYKSLVAMTFTNKAALEMKTRIIDTLDGIAFGLTNSNKIKSMQKDLLERIPITEQDLRERCKQTLNEILHGYEEFHVSTIDKFNLKLIRSFSRDLDIPGDFEVVLNEKQILADVVDAMLNRLGIPGQENLTQLVKEYAKFNFEDGQKWNFRDQLIAFSSVLSNEKYNELIHKLMDMPLDQAAFQSLRKSIKITSDSFLKYANEAGNLFAALELDEKKIPNKSKTTKPLLALASLETFPEPKSNSRLFSDTLIKLIEDTDSSSFLGEPLRQKLGDLIELYDQEFPQLLLLEAYKSNFFNMALLQFIASEMDKLKKDEQIIRISEFNKLISNLVRDEEAPYIYERLGNRLSHFLLDEFQDTSRLQWLNLIPLIHESLSKQKKNLIVGDAKQSIYRFNNGLADQFVALPAIYNPEHNPFIAGKSAYFQNSGHLLTLPNNYRSAQEIVTFNNQFFTELIKELPEKSAAYYNAVQQTSQSGKTGFVRIVSQAEKTNEVELSEDIINIINACEKDNYERGDICILTHTNGFGNKIANALTQANFKVVSVDSLLITNDSKVRLCISYLKRRQNPSNATEVKRFAELFFRITLDSATQEYRAYFEEFINAEGKKIRFFNEFKFLTDHFGGKEVFFGAYENLYDLIQQFFGMMQWKETDEAYLHHFADVCFAFQTNRHTDVASFLNYFEDNKDKIAIQLPSSRDAIQIMTIHKSKGLEFPVVIIPQLDFHLSPISFNKYLIDAGEQVLYKNISPNSKIKAVKDYSMIEQELVVTDKMNMCYVALTRAEDRLYAFNYYKKKEFGAMVNRALGSMQEGVTETDGQIIYQAGTPQLKIEKEIDKDSFYKPIEHTDRLWFPQIVLRDLNQRDPSEEVKFGNQFHLLLAQVNKVEELDQAIESLLETGQITKEQEPLLREKATSLLNNPQYQDLVDRSIKTKSEPWILVSESETKRPDKLFIYADKIVVIDFKTGLRKDKDQQQISAYKKLLEEMMHLPVDSFLYYTNEGVLVAC